jgi:hypothetical protein
VGISHFTNGLSGWTTAAIGRYMGRQRREKRRRLSPRGNINYRRAGVFPGILAVHGQLVQPPIGFDGRLFGRIRTDGYSP